MRPLRFAKPLQHRCAPLQAAPLVQRRQVLLLHLWEGHKIKCEEEDYISFLRWAMLRLMSFWTVLRPRSMPDACRRLRTLATVQHGVSVMMPAISILARWRAKFCIIGLLNKRTNQALFERCGLETQENKTQTSLLFTWSLNVVRHHLVLRVQPLQPPLRCRLRQASVVAIFCCPCQRLPSFH